MRYSEPLKLEINSFLFFYYFENDFFIAGTLVFIKRRQMSYFNSVNHQNSKKNSIKYSYTLQKEAKTPIRTLEN